MLMTRPVSNKQKPRNRIKGTISFVFDLHASQISFRRIIKIYMLNYRLLKQKVIQTEFKLTFNRTELNKLFFYYFIFYF